MSATTYPLIPQVDVRGTADRFKTRIDWLDSKHSFSFGHHRDPDNTHHGLLLVCLLYTSPSPRDRTRSRMPSSA